MALRLDISLPRSWQELTQTQLRQLLSTILNIQRINETRVWRNREEYTDSVAYQILTRCLLLWAGFRVVCRYGKDWLINVSGQEYVVPLETISSAASRLNWISTPPEFPVRLDIIDGAEAVPADLRTGLSFDRWLSCEALWQAYISRQDDNLLRQMAAHLYAKDDIKVDDTEALSIFYWWAGVKSLFSRLFPHFFAPDMNVAGKDEPFDADGLRRNVDAQIRALTKGDITKEPTVLAMDAFRAITELDALAREYDELNKKYPAK